MNYKYKVKRELKVPIDVLEERINCYLIKKAYKITEKGPGYLIFTEEEFSDRRRTRSDFHTRIGNGKFVFKSTGDDGTSLEFIHLTPLFEFFVLVILVNIGGFYLKTFIMPTVMSLFLTIPILYRIIYLNEHVFKEIMVC